MLSLTPFAAAWHKRSQPKIHMVVVSHYDIQNALFRDGFLSVRGYNHTLMYEAYEDLDSSIFGFLQDRDGSYIIYVLPGREMDFYLVCARIKKHWARYGQ
jgi:hypothetical protein